jgi:hypothetical protein
MQAVEALRAHAFSLSYPSQSFIALVPQGNYLAIKTFCFVSGASTVLYTVPST